MKDRVALTAATSYDRTEIEAALERLLAPLGGMAAFVRPGARVLLKPNMLAGKAPDKAVTTHPEIVRAVILQVQRAGGIVSVGDSPGVGTPRQVAQRCGILDVINETGAHFAPFAKSVPVHIASGTFHQLELAQDILDAEVIINLPKLKTHQMMGLTCGVKNLFGAVVGMRKPGLHLQAGTDKAVFALMLLELAERIKPALTIVDAVTGMEGDGPGSGDPVHIGALLAGANPIAVDSVAIALTGLRPDAVWTQHIALRRQLPGATLDQVEILGAELATLRVAHFRPSKSTDVNFGLPTFLSRPLRRALTARPVVDGKRCRACGLCVKHCPPAAMVIRDGQLHIDEHACIRCFCCQELCPHAALQTRQGALLRLRAFLSRG